MSLRERIIQGLAMALIGLSSANATAQQVSLYDADGTARAYIDYAQDRTVFLWDGTPAAFLEHDGLDLCVIGFNGSFLGWYEDGILYDTDGRVAGFREGSLMIPLRFEPFKGLQDLVPLRPFAPSSPMKPFWKDEWSYLSLEELLLSGVKE